MVDEAVVVLDEPTQNGTDEEQGSDVDDFNYEEYVKYFPVECTESLTRSFSNKLYGWKSRARLILKIAQWSEHVDDLKSRLVELCTGVRTRRPNVITPRDGLRAFINSLAEDKLQLLCNEKSVSYNSFMSTNDKVGLVEAIIDEMLA